MNIFKFFDKLLLNSPSYREGAVVGLINYCMNAYEEAKRTVPGKDPHLYLAMVNSLLLKMQGSNPPLYKHKDAENLVMWEALLHRNTVYSACVPWPVCVKVLVYMSLLDTHRGFSEDFLKPPYEEEYEELVSPLCAMDREILEQFYRENNPNSNYLDENYFKQMTMMKAIDEGSSSDITLPEEAEFFLKNINKGVAFTRMIDMNPKSAVAYCHRGVTHMNGRSYKQAIEDFDKAIELNPKFAEAYSNRGVAYAKFGNENQAIRDCNKAIELRPKDAQVYNSLTNVYVHLSKFKEAYENMKIAVRLSDKVDKQDNLLLEAMRKLAEES